MMNIIVDTSVVTKWYAQKDENDLEQAFHLLESCNQNKLALICPKIILLELANVLYVGKKLTKELCLASISSFKKLCEELVDIENTDLMIEIMYSYKLPSYDAIFIALAIKKQIPLVTADYKHHLKSITPRIIWLSEWNGILK